MLCIENGQNISLAGYSGSDIFQFLRLTIHKCNQSVDNNCDTTANIDAFVLNHETLHDFFKVNLYIVDTILAPGDHEAINYVL